MNDIPAFLRTLAAMVEENGGQLPELGMRPVKKAKKRAGPVKQNEVSDRIKAIVKRELYGKGIRKH